MIKIVYLTIALLLCFSCNNRAVSDHKSQPSDTESTQIGTKVPENQRLKFTSGIRSIWHARNGDYWFGSDQEGACRFDGDSLVYFSEESGQIGNQVRAIQEGENGVIWFETGNGISSFDGQTMTKHTSKTSLDGIGLGMEHSWAKGDVDLWFNAEGKAGVYRFDGQKLGYLALPIPNGKINPMLFGVTGISSGKSGSIWIATYAALFGYDGTSFTLIDDASLGYSEQTGSLHIRSVLEDSKGNVWIGNNGIGVLLFDGKTTVNFSEKNGLIHPSSSKSGDYSPMGTLEHVFAIAEDNQGNIWFGDRDTGAWKYDGKTMTHYLIDPNLTSQHIWDIYQDPNGDLLFAMRDGGVYQYNEGLFVQKF